MTYLFSTLVLLFCSSAFGQQQVRIVSHYPESAFMVNRMLPFTVQGSNVENVVSVITQGNDSCVTMVDPYYSQIFHLYCREEGIVDLAVTIDSTDRFDSFVSLNNIRIQLEGAVIEPTTEPFAEEEAPF